MKIFLSSVALFMCVISATAQNSPAAWMQAQGTLEGSAIDSQYFTMVTDANLRDQPNTQSKVLTKLPIATSVTVVEVSEETYSQRGVTLPWVKVRATMPDKRTATGFLWGGFLALAHIQTPDEEYMPNRGVLYLTGVAAYDSTKHELTAQVRVAKDQKELAKTEFTTTGDLSYYPSFAVDYSPFKGVNAVLTVNYYYLPAVIRLATIYCFGRKTGNSTRCWKPVPSAKLAHFTARKIS